jgi:hypothetical protein
LRHAQRRLPESTEPRPQRPLHASRIRPLSQAAGAIGLRGRGR